MSGIDGLIDSIASSGGGLIDSGALLGGAVVLILILSILFIWKMGLWYGIGVFFIGVILLIGSYFILEAD